MIERFIHWLFEWILNHLPPAEREQWLRQGEELAKQEQERRNAR